MQEQCMRTWTTIVGLRPDQSSCIKALHKKYMYLACSLIPIRLFRTSVFDRWQVIILEVGMAGQTANSGSGNGTRLLCNPSDISSVGLSHACTEYISYWMTCNPE